MPALARAGPSRRRSQRTTCPIQPSDVLFAKRTITGIKRKVRTRQQSSCDLLHRTAKRDQTTNTQQQRGVYNDQSNEKRTQANPQAHCRFECDFAKKLHRTRPQLNTFSQYTSTTTQGGLLYARRRCASVVYRSYLRIPSPHASPSSSSLRPGSHFPPCG